MNDEAADPERSVVLSYAYWQRHFGGDSSIIGKPVIVFRDVPFTVIGVAERGFRGIEADRSTDAWWPVGTAKLMSVDRLREWNVTVMGRLKPGVEIVQASAEARLLHAAIVADEAAEHADWNAARRRRFLARQLTVESGATGVADALRSRFTQPLYVLMGTGCETVTRIQTKDTDLVSGVWKDGRVGTYRGIRRNRADFDLQQQRAGSDADRRREQQDQLRL